MRARSILKGAALVGAALAVGVASSTEEGRRVDAELFRKGNADRGPSADRVAESITELGSWWAAGGAAVALAVLGRHRPAARALTGASVTWLAGQGLKRVFLRPRPYDADPAGTRLLIGKPNGTSWPSSHPAVLVTFLAIVQEELALSRPVRRGLRTLGNAVGTTRVRLGVHYPSDVLGGILLGRGVAELFNGAR